MVKQGTLLLPLIAKAKEKSRVDQGKSRAQREAQGQRLNFN